MGFPLGLPIGELLGCPVGCALGSPEGCCVQNPGRYAVEIELKHEAAHVTRAFPNAAPRNICIVVNEVIEHKKLGTLPIIIIAIMNN